MTKPDSTSEKFLRVMTVLVIASLLFLTSGLLPVARSASLSYISDPSNIPYISIINAPPSILPGTSDFLNFTLKNRYARQMENVSIAIEIYGAGLTSWLSSKIEYKSIGELSHPPEIEESVASGNANHQAYTYTMNTLKNNTTFPVKVKILTSKDTPDAEYFVRFNLTFDYDGGRYVMLSRGYFSEQDWAYASSVGDKYTTNLNMSFIYQKYGAVAVLPDTVVTVRTPIPLWPFYLLFVAMCFFALFAAFSYLKEEKKATFPFLEKRLYKWIGKTYELRKFPEKKKRKTRLKI